MRAKLTNVIALLLSVAFVGAALIYSFIQSPLFEFRTKNDVRGVIPQYSYATGQFLEYPPINMAELPQYRPKSYWRVSSIGNASIKLPTRCFLSQDELSSLGDEAAEQIVQELIAIIRTTKEDFLKLREMRELLDDSNIEPRYSIDQKAIRSTYIACSLPKLGQFGPFANISLPYVIPLLEDPTHAEQAFETILKLGSLTSEELRFIINVVATWPASTAVQHLSKLASNIYEEAIPALSELLLYPDTRVKKLALDIIGEKGTKLPGIYESVLKLLDNRDTSLRTQALLVLSKIETPEAILFSNLRRGLSDESPVRKQVIEIISQKPERFVELDSDLTKFILADQFYDDMARAITALSLIPKDHSEVIAPIAKKITKLSPHIMTDEPPTLCMAAGDLGNECGQESFKFSLCAAPYSNLSAQLIESFFKLVTSCKQAATKPLVSLTEEKSEVLSSLALQALVITEITPDSRSFPVEEMHARSIWDKVTYVAGLRKYSDSRYNEFKNSLIKKDKFLNCIQTKDFASHVALLQDDAAELFLRKISQGQDDPECASSFGLSQIRQISSNFADKIVHTLLSSSSNYSTCLRINLIRALGNTKPVTTSMVESIKSFFPEPTIFTCGQNLGEFSLSVTKTLLEFSNDSDEADKLIRENISTKNKWFRSQLSQILSEKSLLDHFKNSNTYFEQIKTLDKEENQTQYLNRNSLCLNSSGVTTKSGADGLSNRLAKGGNVDDLKLAHESGELDLNAFGFDCVSVLRSAIYGGKTDNVSYLISLGANPNEKDRNRASLLNDAIWRKDPTMVSILLEAGADPNSHEINGSTPLFNALQAKHPKIALLLLENGAGVGAINMAYGIRGPSAIMMAYEEFHSAALRFGRQTNILAGPEDFLTYREWEDLFNKILLHKPDLNYQRYDGSTILHLAAQTKDLETFNRLIEAGANPLIKNCSGISAESLIK